jgi:hypothetical protein
MGRRVSREEQKRWRRTSNSKEEKKVGRSDAEHGKAQREKVKERLAIRVKYLQRRKGDNNNNGRCSETYDEGAWENNRGDNEIYGAGVGSFGLDRAGPGWLQQAWVGQSTRAPAKKATRCPRLPWVDRRWPGLAWADSGWQERHE